MKNEPPSAEIPHYEILEKWPPRVTLGRLLSHARGLGFKPRRGGFPSGAKKEWGLSPKAKVRVLHTAQLDFTGVLGIDYDSMASLRMWFHRMAVMDIGYNFGNCDHRIDFGGRKRVDHLHVSQGQLIFCSYHICVPLVCICYNVYFLAPRLDIVYGLYFLADQGKLDQVVAIVKSCSSNLLGDLTVTMKDMSGTIPGTVHHKVIGKGGYGKDITVGAALILANVSVFSPKPSMHYLNITMRNVVKIFHKDTVPRSSSG
nr:hypothetical protein [Tanacetum cinerariifolium]